MRELGHLPLAIDLAGALMTEYQIMPFEFFENYKKYFKDRVSNASANDMLEHTNAAYEKQSGLHGTSRSNVSRPEIPWQLNFFVPSFFFIQTTYPPRIFRGTLKRFSVLITVRRRDP